MMKQPFSIAPWSLILSLYFVPAQDSYAQESDEVETGELDSTESTGEAETAESSELESSGDNGDLEGTENESTESPLKPQYYLLYNPPQ